MKAVIAIDSFKGSMTSIEAGQAAAEGIRRVFPNADICVLPVADGGEGTVDALVTGMHGQKQTVTVSDPLGRPVCAEYGILPDGTAVIEMAAAAGLPLLKQVERNPMKTTTYGVGQLIKDAVGKGCRQFVIGIGGSATNDGGMGMLQALGFEFTDDKGQPVGSGAEGLKNLSAISDAHALAELSECSFSVACDVTNPLCGPKGCSAVYGPQKGADETAVEMMDKWLEAYSRLVQRIRPEANPEAPGAGAAGGIGFAFSSFLNGQLQGGIDLVLDKIGLEQAVKSADIVLTGEGRLDSQTVMGKAPAGVAKAAKRYGKTVLAFAGMATPEARVCNEHIDAYFPILRRVCTLEEAMEPENAKSNMTETVEQVFRLYK